MNLPRVGYHRSAEVTPREVRLLVRERDGKRCTKCGSRKHLTTHHIRPISTGGAALDPANLTTLCRTCHDAVHRMGKRT